ncbi:hypothetical protein HHUSO_G330 [Huso huso]|uniref:Peptidase A2 domain-containing protein n=1 Tax=Huso huso TaxID=61971 RepID=A0ABR1ABL1_HUSHU
MVKFHPPDNFDFSRPELWPEWRQRFLRYRIATKLDKESGEVQVCTLIYSLGKEAENVLKTFTFDTNTDDKDYDIVMRKMDEYFVPKRNIIHERARFHQRVQKQGETIEEYIRSLYELAETCAFGDAKSESIRDRLVIGILDKDMSQKLQLKPELTLEKAIQLTRQSELIKEQLTEQGTSSALCEVTREHKQRLEKTWPNRGYKEEQSQKHTQPKRGWGKTTQKQGQKYETLNGPKCTRCGRAHVRGDNCIARNAECHKCKKIGHFAVVCRTRVVNEVIAGGNHESKSKETLFLGSVTRVDDSSKAWKIDLMIQGTAVNFKIDTGADTTVISETTYFGLKNTPQLQSTGVTLDSPGGKLKCVGQFLAKTKYKAREYQFKVYVISGSPVSNLLGRDVAATMGIVYQVNEIYSELFGNIGLLKTNPVKISLKEGAIPYSIPTARRISLPMLPKVKQELERMIECGVIEEIKEPTEWCAPMVPVPKKNGSVRICVDLKQLNKAVQREIRPTNSR